MFRFKGVQSREGIDWTAREGGGGSGGGSRCEVGQCRGEGGNGVEKIRDPLSFGGERNDG